MKRKEENIVQFTWLINKKEEYSAIQNLDTDNNDSHDFWIIGFTEKNRQLALYLNRRESG